MSPKIRVGVLFGGKSAEHEVSLQSAKNVVNAMDKSKYEVILIGIDKRGRWHLGEDSHFLLHAENPRLLDLHNIDQNVALVIEKESGVLMHLSCPNKVEPVDVIFPVLHGPFGEDGTVQGLLKLANVPYVGAGVLGSAVGMDKDVMKRLLRDAGVPTPKFLVFNRQNSQNIKFDQVVQELGLPFFVKPANLGSSVGINKVKTQADFTHAIADALLYDNKFLIEEFIKGREIECSVLGNETPIASFPGEIIPQHEFYSYDAKYLDEKGAILEIPAQLSDDLVKNVQHLAIKAFQVLCCEGMARVDFFLRDNQELLVNELNTIPGFTRISMYPKLWEYSGISYSDLIDRLIQLALERHENEKRLRSSVTAE